MIDSLSQFGMSQQQLSPDMAAESSTSCVLKLPNLRHKHAPSDSDAFPTDEVAVQLWS